MVYHYNLDAFFELTQTERMVELSENIIKMVNQDGLLFLQTWNFIPNTNPSRRGDVSEDCLANSVFGYLLH